MAISATKLREAHQAVAKCAESFNALLHGIQNGHPIDSRDYRHRQIDRVIEDYKLARSRFDDSVEELFQEVSLHQVYWFGRRSFSSAHGAAMQIIGGVVERLRTDPLESAAGSIIGLLCEPYSSNDSEALINRIADEHVLAKGKIKDDGGPKNNPDCPECGSRMRKASSPRMEKRTGRKKQYYRCPLKSCKHTSSEYVD